MRSPLSRRVRGEEIESDVSPKLLAYWFDLVLSFQTNCTALVRAQDVTIYTLTYSERVVFHLHAIPRRACLLACARARVYRVACNRVVNLLLRKAEYRWRPSCLSSRTRDSVIFFRVASLVYARRNDASLPPSLPPSPSPFNRVNKAIRSLVI